jgi:hypothetical protein
MLAPHDWPRPVKHLLLTGATLLVILAYILLCAGSAFLTAALFYGCPILPDRPVARHTSARRRPRRH